MRTIMKAGLCAGSLSLLASAPPALADHKPLEEVIVRSFQEQSETILDITASTSADSSEQLLRAPGVALNKNGPLTSLPQIRGMSGGRLAVTIDGAPVTSAGPNLMDPPLSYTSTQMIETITVHRGVAPVSVSQSGIGGAIEVEQWQPSFSDGDLRLGGDIALGYANVDESSQFDLRAFLASSHQRLKFLASRVAGEDAGFPGGKIVPSGYDREQYQLGYGFRTGAHELDASWLVNRTNDTGTPALPMDILSIDADIWRLNYQWTGDRYQARARLYGNDTEHGMTNYHMRTAPANGMNWRRNFATAEGRGGNIEVAISQPSGPLVIGLDYQNQRHHSRIDNPNMAAFFVANFNAVETATSSLFIEKDLQLSDQVFGQLGARFGRIENSAGDVNATPAMMMPAAGMLRDNFNASNDGRSDNTTDIVAKLSYRHSDQATFYLGLAHKQRVPGYVELYLWLPLESTGGLADGNLYTGDPDLRVETNREIELGFDWTGKSLALSPRVFYRKVGDYVQGEPGSVAPAIMFAAMMRPGGNPPLRFSNVDATFWGADMTLSYKLAAQWQVNAVANYVRAETADHQPLYRISPLNGYATLQWQREDRGALLRIKGFSRQDRVSESHFEQSTPGAGIIDLSAYQQVTDKVTLTLGVDNLADRQYRQHLGGYNRAENPDIDLMTRLPGYGRNWYLRLDANF